MLYIQIFLLSIVSTAIPSNYSFQFPFRDKQVMDISRMLLAPCEIDLPCEKFASLTLKGIDGIKGKSDDVIITQIESGRLRISDFSAGLLGQLGFSNSNPAIVTLNSLNKIDPASFSTSYGVCEIKGGSWDSSSKRLTLNWEIPFNQMKDTSVFTCQ